MSWRTVIVSSISKLDYSMGYLVIRNETTSRIHIDEISILLIENPAISITGFLLEALIEKKIKVIFCDSKRSPVSELVPHHGSHDSSAKIRIQMGWDDNTKGIIWREIVTEKVFKQAELLDDIEKKEESSLLRSYTEQVELFDKTNREGHAAKVYFNALFGMSFTRSALNPINAALNYGYGIILSSFNREISSNGYLTQLGIFHSNVFNHFNLACDFMEPFRVLVDRRVVAMKPEKFDTDEKHILWEMLSDTIIIDSTKQIIQNAIKIYTKSLFDAINEKDPSKIKFYTIEK